MLYWKCMEKKLQVEREWVLTVTCKNLLSEHFKQIINGFVFVYKLIVLNQKKNEEKNQRKIVQFFFLVLLFVIFVNHRNFVYLFFRWMNKKKCTHTHNAIQLPKATHKTHSIEWHQFAAGSNVRETDIHTRTHAQNWLCIDSQQQQQQPHASIQSGTCQSKSQMGTDWQQISQQWGHCTNLEMYISISGSIGWYFVTKELIQ